MEDQLLEKFLDENGGRLDFLNPIVSDKISIGRLNDICSRIPDEGTYLVISHYGTLANGVAGQPTATVDVILESSRIIHKGLQKLRDDISVHGQNVENFELDEVLKLRRSLAVMVYLAYRALSGIEGQSVKHHLDNNLVVSGKKTKKVVNQNRAAGTTINWMSWRSTIIEDLLALLSYPIEKIWEDSGYGFSVPRLMLRTLCLNLDEPYLAKDNLRAGSDAFKILGIIAKRFNKQLEVYELLFPLIKCGEDVAKIVTRAIDLFVSEFQLTDSVPIALASVLELWESSEKNQHFEKGVATLILDLCENCPRDVILKSARTIFEYLHVDSVPVRSAVITGVANLLRWMKTENGRGQGGRMMRNFFVKDFVVKHTMDVAALVRSKALNVMVKLIDDKELEPLEVAECLTAATSRIVDTAVLPRKYAASIVTAILGKFPGIVNQQIDFANEVYRNRKRLLELLLRKSPRKDHYIYALVREFVDQAMQQTIPLPDEFKLIIEEGTNAVREKVGQLLADEKYWDACIILCHGVELYGNEAGKENMGKKLTVNMYLKYFKLYRLVRDDGSPDQSQNNSILDTSINLSESMSQPDPNGDAGGVPWLEPDEIEQERQLFKFALGCEKMSKSIEPLVTQMIILLQTGNGVDKNEMIALFGYLIRCGYPLNERISGPIIEAIASAGKDSAENLLPSFWDIFIGERNIASVPLIRKLFQTLNNVESTVKELLQPIIQEMYSTKALTTDAVMRLWDAFTRQYDCWSKEDARNAIFVLGGLGKRDANVIYSNLNLLIEKGLSDEAFSDMILVKYVLEAILFSFKKTKKGESDIGYSIRLESNHVLFSRLSAVLNFGLTKKGDKNTHLIFPHVAELAIQIIYKVSWEHSTIIRDILQILPTKMFDNISGGSSELNGTNSSEIQGTEESYIRYMSIMTAMLGSHINYYETIVLPEIRRRKQLQQAADQKKQKNNKKGGKSKKGKNDNNNKRSSNASIVSNASSTRATSSSSRVSNISTRSTRGALTESFANGSALSNVTATASEMDVMIGNAGFDAEHEMVKTYIEKILDTGVFLQYRRITIYLCQKIKKIKHLKLQLIIVQALAKLMLVSPESALRHVDSFVALWNTIANTSVKIEILKQLTVLNVRFPNQMEKCNIIIQSGLGSSETEIKIACLDCMAFLALGEMVKIRDNIAEVALCLCDKDANIKEMAQDFFNVCAEKDNVISNAVPEVISRLSKKDKISQQEFQSIMRFLLTRVKKEKQVVGLVDTLVGRFKSTQQQQTGEGGHRLWQDTAYCLSQLPHQEKTFKLLRDNMANYSDKLDDDIVFSSFATIVEALRKNVTKPEFKLKLDEFQADLEDANRICLEKRRIAGAANRQRQNQGKKKNSMRRKSTLEDEHSSLMENIENNINIKGETEEENDDVMDEMVEENIENIPNIKDEKEEENDDGMNEEEDDGMGEETEEEDDGMGEETEEEDDG